MPKKLKDRLWLWGQTAGSHHAASANASWKLPGTNRMSPEEGADFLGISRMCRVVMGGHPQPPFDAEQELLSGMKEVVWSAIGDAGSTRNDKLTDEGEVLRLAARYPNVTGAILDDFFNYKGGRLSVEAARAMKARLAAALPRPLDFWIVCYKQGPDYDIDEYLQAFDVITFWNMWAPAQRAEWEADIARLVERTPGKRRLAGCYLWNYGGGKPLTLGEIEAECETYREWIRQGRIEGIIFCSNCCADLGLESVEWVRRWIRQNGEEEI